MQQKQAWPHPCPSSWGLGIHCPARFPGATAPRTLRLLGKAQDMASLFSLHHALPPAQPLQEGCASWARLTGGSRAQVREGRAGSVCPKHPMLWLLLVLALCRSKEILQNTLYVLKSGTILGSDLPAPHHDVIQLLRAVSCAGHPVSMLQCSDHLRTRHPWENRVGQINITWFITGCFKSHKIPQAKTSLPLGNVSRKEKVVRRAGMGELLFLVRETWAKELLGCCRMEFCAPDQMYKFTLYKLKSTCGKSVMSHCFQ